MNRYSMLLLLLANHIALSTLLYNKVYCQNTNLLPCASSLACSNCGILNCTSCNRCQNSCTICRPSRDIYCNSCCYTCPTGTIRPCSTTARTISQIDNNNQADSCSNTNTCTRTQRQCPCPQNFGSSTSNDCCLSNMIPRSIFIPRSQGNNTARELVGWQEYIHRFNFGKNYLTTGQTLGYSRSIRPDRIARTLFGDCVLNFAGSQVTERTPCQILADNFGLSPSFTGSLRITPLIENIIFDNQFFLGLDQIACGLFARLHIPLVHTRWHLGLCQTNTTKQENCPDFPACYMGSNRASATCDILQALSGDFTFGAMQESWRFGRFCTDVQTKTRLANIDFALGWDFWRNPLYHLGLYAQISAPTGNKTHAHTVFEPIVGNGGHWEIGAGLSGHLLLWQRGCDQSLAIYVEANATHLAENIQYRSFDFAKNGLLSRYALLKEFSIVNKKALPTGNLINAININTLPVHSSITIKGDISVKLALRTCCFSCDIGYNFYGNTHEKLRHCCISDDNDTKLYAIKGTEGTCALEYTTVGTIPPLSFGSLAATIPLNSTQSKATIRSAAPTDNPQAISLLSPTNIAVTAQSRQEGLIVGPNIIQAELSHPPVLLSKRNLNICSGAATPSATHKVFGYISYTLSDSCWYTSYIGLGGELEVEALACNQQTSLNQWSLWLKGGVTF